jgi:hypothetical protein
MCLFSRAFWDNVSAVDRAKTDARTLFAVDCPPVPTALIERILSFDPKDAPASG